MTFFYHRISINNEELVKFRTSNKTVIRIWTRAYRNFLKDYSMLRDRAFFYDRIFVKILITEVPYGQGNLSLNSGPDSPWRRWHSPPGVIVFDFDCCRTGLHKFMSLRIFTSTIRTKYKIISLAHHTHSRRFLLQLHAGSKLHSRDWLFFCVYFVFFIVFLFV